MKKNSTLIYFVNNIQPNQASVRSGIDEFDDVLRKAENAEMEPSDEIISNILGFAKSYEVIETEKSGLVEMNLN